VDADTTIQQADESLADMTTTESALENGNSEEPIIMSPAQPQLQEQEQKQEQLQEQADSSALLSTDQQEHHNEIVQESQQE